MHECAEQILATRRRISYSSVDQNTCSSLGNYAGFGTPALTVTANNVSGTPSCPGVPCCDSKSTSCTVTVTLSKSGATLTPVVLQLVNY